MYGIFPYIYHKNQPNVGKYTMHVWYEYWSQDWPPPQLFERVEPDSQCSKMVPWVKITATSSLMVYPSPYVEPFFFKTCQNSFALRYHQLVSMKIPTDPIEHTPDTDMKGFTS